MTKVEIQLSKTKMSLMLLGSIAFVISGILFIITPETFISFIHPNPNTIRLAGIAAVLFFGATSIYGAKKLFDKSLGLTIDDNGINDNSNASSVGLIDWEDIIKIQTKQVKSTRFLLIFISNPNKYYDRVGGLKRKLMKANMRMYGTPLSIVSNTLKCNFNDLEKLISDGLNEHHARLPNR
jgi:hypothetical protein